MHLSRSSSRIVMVTMGIRIMANLPDRKDDQRRVDHGGQSGHFYLAESGHFYLGITSQLRIMYIMLNKRLWRLVPLGLGCLTSSSRIPSTCPHAGSTHCRMPPHADASRDGG